MTQSDEPEVTAPPPPPAAPSGRCCEAWSLLKAALGALVIAAAVTAIYRRALDAPFVFDDQSTVVSNPSITQLWPLVGSPSQRGPLNPPPQFCTAGRPLVNLTLALNYHFSGLKPAGYHAFNIALHTASALLVWGLVRRTLQLPYFKEQFARTANLLAFLAALVWAVHPLHTETLIYVTQRTELLVSFFYLATLYASLRYWQATSHGPRRIWLIVAVLSCLGGMASKEVMVSAPVMVLLFERTFIAGSFRRAWAQSWPLYLGLALGWALLFVLHADGPRSDSVGFGLGISAHQWWLTQTRVLLLYLKLAVWPWPLCIHYQEDYLTSLSDAWRTLLPALLLVVAAALLAWRRTSTGYVLLWMFAILSPTLVVPITTEVAAERRMYLPLAALVPWAIAGAYAFFDRRHARSTDDAASARAGTTLAPILITSCCIALIFAIVNTRRLNAYHDAVTLWHDTALRQPASATVRINLGMALMQAGRPLEAAQQFEVATQLKPGAADAWNNLALASISTDQTAEAVAAGERAVALAPEFAEAHNNLAVALLKAGQSAAAVKHFEEALHLRPNYLDAHMNLGLALAHSQDHAAAIKHLAVVVEQRPELLAAYGPLVRAYAAQGQQAEAIATARQALRLAQSQGKPVEAEQIGTWLRENGDGVHD